MEKSSKKKGNFRKGKEEKLIVESDGGWWWLIHRGITASFLSIALFSLLVRVAVSLHPYSGAKSSQIWGL
ncbi:hypothetical protein FF1_044346 [Malus domestica]